MVPTPVTADLALMRELNQTLILNLVRQAGQISRAEIAKRTNLSRSTVSNIINELIESGRIFELHKGVSRGGRRPILLELNYHSHCAVGVEIATTALNLVITDLQALVLHEESRPFDINQGPDAAIDEVRQLVDDALKRAPIGSARVAGVGLGVPGPIAFASGQPIAPPIMPGWSGVKLRERFGDALKCPVLVDNDANLGALAEYLWGAAQGVRNLGYIYLGSTGIGTGLILNGSVFRGEIGSAGELGHITIDEDGPQCSCGSYGCLEAMAGLPRILQRAAELGCSAPSLNRLIDMACGGDQRVQELFRESGRHIGVAVSNLLNIFNPGLIVLGGVLADAGHLLMEPVRQTARKRALSASVEHCGIVLSKLGSNAVALGAASQIIQSMFSSTSFDTLVGQL